MSEEIWRPVVGYEGSYEVSDHGRVRSLDRIAHNGARWRGRMLKPGTSQNGYRCVALLRDGKQRTWLVHQLVLRSFVVPPQTGLWVLHNDGDGSNNHLDNLRWGTQSDNMFDAVTHKTHANATKTSCVRGHLYTEENTYVRAGGRGRACRECVRASHRRHKSKMRELRKNQTKESAA